MTKAAAEQIAGKDSTGPRSVRVVAREIAEPDPEEGYAPMDPETWNLLRDRYRLVSVWQRGQKVRR